MKMIFCRENKETEDLYRVLEFETHSSENYFAALEEIISVLNDFNSFEEKITCLTYITELIKNAVVSEYAALSAYPYYCKATPDYKDCLTSCIQTFSQFGREESEIETLGKEILTTVVKYKNLLELLKSGKCGGISRAIYVKQLDLIVAYEDGYHRLAALKYLKKNEKIPVYVIDLEKQYSTIFTNGVYWLHINNTDSKEIISDYRFAVIYTILKIKSCLLGNLPCFALAIDGISVEKSGKITYNPEKVKKYSEQNKVSLSSSSLKVRKLFKTKSKIYLEIKNSVYRQ
jgi:hypothetical protein